MAQTIWPPSKQEKTVKANTSPDTSLAATSDPFGEGKCKRTSQSVKTKKYTCGVCQQPLILWLEVGLEMENLDSGLHWLQIFGKASDEPSSFWSLK